MREAVQLVLRWSLRRASRAYRLSSWSCLDLLLNTYFGLEILELDLIADDCVGLGHILGIDFVVCVFGVNDLGVGREEVLIDVLVELLRRRYATLMLFMLIL